MIPRIFHQIWINYENPELPDRFRAYRDGWLTKHPHWEYRLWNLENLDFSPRKLSLIKSAKNYAQMSDILRYEILLHHGGVYLDTDFECQKNIDPILNGVNNFACSEDNRIISIGIIGSVPNSVYMERCLNELPLELGLSSTPNETGPVHFTRVLLNYGLAGDFTLFPRQWFYPYNWDEPHRADETFPKAYAVHRWAHSWRPAPQNLFARVLRRFRKWRILSKSKLTSSQN